jgi:hypothetical protein
MQVLRHRARLTPSRLRRASNTLQRMLLLQSDLWCRLVLPAQLLRSQRSRLRRRPPLSVHRSRTLCGVSCVAFQSQARLLCKSTSAARSTNSRQPRSNELSPQLRRLPRLLARSILNAPFVIDCLPPPQRTPLTAFLTLT